MTEDTSSRTTARQKREVCRRGKSVLPHAGHRATQQNTREGTALWNLSSRSTRELVALRNALLILLRAIAAREKEQRALAVERAWLGKRA
eukprot:2189659-Rhodomonas_salina.1